jgi:hypothetical protein
MSDVTDKRPTMAIRRCVASSKGVRPGTIHSVERWEPMRLHSYMDENRSRHIDLIGGRSRRWSIDVIAVIASGILLMGFACAVAALWVH